MKILIIDQLHESIHPLMKAADLHYDYRPEIKKEEVLEILPQYEGIMVRSKMRFDQPELDRGTKLQFIARSGAGMDNIDDAYATKKGIHLINAPEGNRDAVGEHTIGMLLLLMNKMHTADLEVRKGIWDREGNRGWELMGRTVGIIGYGHMGQAFAKRLAGFGVKVLAYDKYRLDYSDQYAQEASLEEIFNDTDVLSFHTPLTEETRAWCTLEFFKKFRKPIIFLNAARGEIAPLHDLNEAIDQKLILAAGLDVLEVEKFDKLTPKQKEELKQLQERANVIFTPHVGGWTFESYQRLNEVMIQKIQAFLEGT
ncbi:NAD(P)-dependent oxidoreductase [Persicobacter diffluens]|uniref:2-hydroxyacid dehydrogenase n=1 Tax=Persicobacter diffluens TaxID=981 RepID=A0AAN4VYE6_9BACT|nr:2-hydroxyacid dehydrogenase [Persicobacter diffluens]